MRNFQYILTILFSVFVASCATTPSPIAPQNQNVAWDNRSQALSNIHHWDINGLLAFRHAQSATSATLHWEQNGQNYALTVLGPMGTNTYRLSGMPGKVELTDPNGKKFYAHSPEELLAKQTGWNLPVSYLFYWVRGLPVPNLAADKHYDNFHHLTELTQEGWKVQYLKYTSVGKIDLPSKIFMDSPKINVKIIISQWQL